MRFSVACRIYGICFLGLVGCGAGDSEDSKKKPEFQAGENPKSSDTKFTSFAVAAASDLPTCKKEIEGSVAYLSSEKKLRVCSSGSWSDADIKGEKGEPGEKGKDGSKGDKGDTGEGGLPGADGVTKIVASMNCYGSFATLTSGARTLNGKTLPDSIRIIYDAVIFNSGDVFANAEISDLAAGISNSVFYSVKQAGAATAAVQVASDYFTPSGYGYWTVSVDRNTAIATARYNDFDFGQAPNYLEWSFLPSACTIQNY